MDNHKLQKQLRDTIIELVFLKEMMIKDEATPKKVAICSSLVQTELLLKNLRDELGRNIDVNLFPKGQ